MTGTLVSPETITLSPRLVVPTIGPKRPRATRSGRKVAVAPLLVMVLTAWLIASFWISVDTRSPRQPFAAPTAGQTWIRSPEAGPHAFFRLNLDLRPFRKAQRCG